MDDVVVLRGNQLEFPHKANAALGIQASAGIAALGSLDLLHSKPTALFCSVKCLGDLILKAYDLARTWRDAGVAVSDGFHSPMEQECLTILLTGR